MRRERQEWYAAVTAHAAYFGERWRYYFSELASMLRFVIPPDVSLVQIGPGTGDLLARLPGASRTGIECSPALLSLARARHPDLDLIEDDFWALATTRRFDYALLSEVTDSLVDVDVVLRETRRLLTEEGRLIIVTRSFLWRPLFALARLLFAKTQSPFRSLLRRRDLENLLSVAGFEVIRSGRGVLCPIYIPLVSVVANRFLVRLPLIEALSAVRYVVARPAPRARRDPSVSVIVAARNEEGNVATLLARVPPLGSQTEIVFVEGHSKDATWRELERLKATYQGPYSIQIAKQEGKGKWDAVKKGFDLATGELLMILDADMTVPPEDLVRFYDAYADGRGDFINGSRLVYPMEKGAMRFLNKLGNRFFAIMVGAVIDQRLTDTLCGTKVLRRSDWGRIANAWAQVGLRDPFGDFELLFGAAKLNLRITELPVRYRDRTFGETQIHRFRDGWVLLKLTAMALIRFRLKL